MVSTEGKISNLILGSGNGTAFLQTPERVGQCSVQHCSYLCPLDPKHRASELTRFHWSL